MLVAVPYVDRAVRFYLRVRHRPLASYPFGLVGHFQIVDRRHPLVLPFGDRAVEHQVRGLVIVQRAQQMYPAEGEEMPTGLLQRLGDAREGYAEGHEVVVLVHEQGTPRPRSCRCTS